MRFIVAALIALSASAEAIAESMFSQSARGPYTATPGDEIARIQKQRPLPNAFGFGDIFGRKDETGLIQFVFFGHASDGKAMIRRIDIEVLSTATTMSRTPGFISGRVWSNGHAWGTFSGSGQFSGTSSGGAQIFGMSLIRVQHRPSAARRRFVGRSVADHPTPHGTRCFSVTAPRTPKEVPAKPSAAKPTTSGKPAWAPW